MAPKEYSAAALCGVEQLTPQNKAPQYGAIMKEHKMTNTQVAMISELSDLELDTVAAGRRGQVAVDNFALQIASNAQVNISSRSRDALQGGNQGNTNNAGNIS